MPRRLVSIARRNGIAEFTADTLYENKAVFHNSGPKVTNELRQGAYSFQMDFE